MKPTNPRTHELTNNTVVVDRVEAIVIGAGPAGATAARALALAGVRTQLLDRARFPRNKPCGGAITSRTLRRFPWLEPALGRISTHWISRLQLESPAREAVELRSETPAALMIRRVEFDALLVTLAREAGAEVVEGADVTGAEQTDRAVHLRTRDRRAFAAPVAIACDGVHGVVARRLGLAGDWPREHVAIDMMEETPSDRLRARDPEALWVSYGYRAGRGLTDGYAYMFPKRDYVNVGLGYVVSHYRAVAPGPAYGLQRALVDTLKHDGVLEGDSRRDCFTPYLIPVGGPLRTTVHGRVLVAGDAGGFVHGSTAEGIYYAMVTGELAGRTAADALRRANHAPPDLSAYPAAWRRECDTELRDSVLLQRYLFDDPRRIESVIAGARRRPALAAAVVQCAMGLVSYRRARRAVLSANPLLALRLAAAFLRPRR